MKIVCEKEKLLRGINSVVRGVPSKTTMPILEGILIQTNQKELKLTTYDLELGIEYIIECEVEEEGNTVVNATMFSEIIRKLPDTEIKIEINESNLLVIECEGSLYKLSTMNAEEFPELPKINIENSIETEQSILKNMIRKTIFAVSMEENRPIFTGCLFEVRNNTLNVVAVDGFRMGWTSNFLDKKTNDFKAVIPGKTLNEVNKIILDSFENIKIGVAKNQAVFEMYNCKIVTRLLDGEFLNYESVIPSSYETRIKVNKSNLQNCFERISLISSSSIEKEKKYPVKMSIDVGKLLISCTNQSGDAKEEIYLETEGKTLEIGVNPKYFLDALRVIEDEEIYISFGSNISPCIIKSTDEELRKYVYMILPIRMKEE
ncbi:MAG: DNA polymerase III subunit beta [Clostridiales bacterium]|nr:DNA polymerase III subunit beta [Clostridiales bacterium]